MHLYLLDGMWNASHYAGALVVFFDWLESHPDASWVVLQLFMEFTGTPCAGCYTAIITPVARVETLAKVLNSGETHVRDVKQSSVAECTHLVQV